MMPIMLSVGAAIPGFPLFGFAMLLALSHGLMGVLTPYATTSGPVYLGSGFITSSEFWRLGFLFGAIFLSALIALSGPWLLTPSFR
jgi:L-tartrate/succinate antiporter